MSRNQTRPSFSAGKPRLNDWGLALLLVTVTLLVYWPALGGGFLLDDDVHIAKNSALLSLHGLQLIWFKPGATYQYYPLTFTWFWVGYHLWGLNPLGYHLSNVLMHVVTALLFWQLLQQLKVPGAFLAGVIFALHPVNVMSVAWMTELKNTLSAALAIGACWAYVRWAGLGVYAASADAEKGRGRSAGRFYVLSLVLFLLAMFAKTAVSLLPVTLLLLVWWRKGRLCWRDALSIVPMLVVVILLGRLTMGIEDPGHTMAKCYPLGLPGRVLVSGRSFWFYLGRLVFPYPPEIIYERWKIDAAATGQYLFPAATLAALGGLWLGRQRMGRAPFVAAMHFFLGTSLLILLEVPTWTKFSFVSDHWQYLGSLSLVALAAAGLVIGLKRWGWAAELGVSGLLLLTLGVMTWNRSHAFSNAQTFYQTILTENPACWMADNNLGFLYLQQDRVNEAVACFQKAIASNPNAVEALDNLGLACHETGQTAEALAYFRQALKIDPGFADAHYNLANTLLQAGQRDEAIVEYQEALRIQPDDLMTCNNLGNAYQQTGQFGEAIICFRKALEINPRAKEICFNLGTVLLRTGHAEAAIGWFEKAVEIDPDFADAHSNLGTACLQMRWIKEAVAHYQKALAIQPRNIGLLNRLAWELATTPEFSLRNGNRAVELARQADQLSGGENPAVLQTLAAAYAESGYFAEAIATAQHAVQLASVQNDFPLADALHTQIGLYQAGSPFRDPGQTNATPKNRP